ncbi:MAG: hypothetical protein ACT4N2_08140 [Hyphomicrobium sp.]
MRGLLNALIVLASLAASACAGPALPPNADAAVRTAPVVTGRPARVFVMAGFGKNCEPLTGPNIAVTQPPAKGDVSFVPGQETTVQYAAGGTCAGQRATGTGIYYTARAGQTGTDRFAVEARLSSGEVARREFEVTIAE